MALTCEIVRHNIVKRPKHVSGTPKPDRQKEVSFHLPLVTADFYDTNLFSSLIYDKHDRSRVLQITNAREIYESGHLQKFLEILQEVASEHKLDFTNFRSATMEYNDHISGESFRAIIDAPDLSALKKLAAIFSTFLISPTLKAEYVLKIARLQKDPIAGADGILLAGLKYFLLPYFDGALDSRPLRPIYRFGIDSESFEPLFRMVGFLHRDDETMTFREFSESVGEDFIASAMGCSRATATEAMKIYVEWGSSIITDLNLANFRRLASIPTHEVSKNLKSLLLQRIVSDEAMAVEASGIFSPLASFLTLDEYQNFYDHLSETSFSKSFPKDLMGALALEIIVLYYWKAGFSKVKELLEIAKLHPEYNGSFYHSRTAFEMKTPVQQKLKAEHFMMLLNDDYREMPLGWALPLISAEIEAMKQEKKKAILAEQLLSVAA